MKKKILSLFIALIMFLGQGLSVCIAAPRHHRNDSPAQHRWFNFWHRDKDKPAAKRKAHPPKKHKIKKKESNHWWFKWRKNENIHKKHQNKKNIKKHEKKKKFVFKKHKKQQKNFQKNKRKSFRHQNNNRHHRLKRK